MNNAAGRGAQKAPLLVIAPCEKRDYARNLSNATADLATAQVLKLAGRSKTSNSSTALA
jgi:hypothetical protein